MMRSLSSAVAGLRTHQTKMDVIGNNIANVNTFGFKSSRTTFADVYYQNLSGSRAGRTGVVGGQNPTQIGYGASIATIDVMMNVSGASTTDRALDVFITGEGFLVTKDPSGKTYYSRMGNMGFDASGNLVDGNGNLVQGFPLKVDPESPDPANPRYIPDVPANGKGDADLLRGIYCSPAILEKMTEISISSSGQIIGFLQGDQTIKPNSQNPNYINALSVPEESTYNGQVTWSLSAMTTPANIAAALGLAGAAGSSTDPANVTKVEMGTLALPAANGTDYKITVVGGLVTMSRESVSTPGAADYQPPVMLTGRFDQNTGKLVLENSNGDVGLTVTIKTGTNIPNSIDRAGLSTPKMVQGYTRTGTGTGADPYVYTKATDAAGDPIMVPARVRGADEYIAATTTADPPVAITTAGGDTVYVLTESVSGATAGDPVFADGSPDARTVEGMVLYEVMKTTDKGNNTVIIGGNNATEATVFVRPTNYPAKMTYGELTFELTEDFSVDAMNRGFIGNIGTAEPGEEIIYDIGQLVLGKFQNASGLQEAGTGVYTATNNSGEAIYVVPGLEGTGGLQSGSLEMSNVDISKEFTDMITTQRGFQANSRIITVSDEMLQELVNLKR